MYGDGDTTLDLAATSIHPVPAGVLEPLLTFLLRARRPVGDDGGAAWSALINACHANARPAAAEFLAARAPALDLEAAAGLGRLDLVAASFEPDGRLKPPATEKQRNDGFMWACEYGRTDVVSLLLAKGMPVGAKGRHERPDRTALGGVGRAHRHAADAVGRRRSRRYPGRHLRRHRARLGPLRVGWRRAAPGRRPLL